MEKTKKQNPQMNQNQIENTNLQEKQFEKEAMKVSTVSIVVNVLLSLFKLLAGVIAHSGAMISDAIHSASDVFSTIIVMVGIHLGWHENRQGASLWSRANGVCCGGCACNSSCRNRILESAGQQFSLLQKRVQELLWFLVCLLLLQQ